MGQKISAMSAASALTGADTLAVVQGGVTKRTTLADVLALAQGTAMTWGLAAVFSGAVTMASTLALAGNLAVNTDKFTVAAATGNTAIAGTLGVAGATTLATLGVTGAATIGTTLGVTGAATMGSLSLGAPLPVASGGTGAATLAGAGIVTTAGGQSIAGTTTLATLGVTGNTTIGGTLDVTGLTTLTALPRLSALTQGSIPFAGASGQIAQANSALFWDGTNSRLGIGNTAPALALEVRGTGAQVAFGAAAKAGYLGANTTVAAASLAYRANHDGTNWIARATSAGSYLVRADGHRWYIDSGLTDGSSFTPTQVMDLQTSGLWVRTAPTAFTTYGIGCRSVRGDSTLLRANGVFEIVANPSGSSTASYNALVAHAEMQAGNAQNITTNPIGLVGLRANLLHAGDGTITNAVALYVPTASNTGAGTITNVIGLHIAAQTAGTNNWGVYQLGASTPNLFAGPLRLGSTGGPLVQSGTGTPEGAVTAPIGSLFLRTNGGSGTTLYCKTSGTGNTGWAAVA